MENNHDTLDLDLEDILQEFQDQPEPEEAVDMDPTQKLDFLSELSLELSSDSPASADASQTQDPFSITALLSEDPAPAETSPAPETEEPEKLMSRPTQKLPEVSDTQVPEEASAPNAAGDTPGTVPPAPIPFVPRSRLRELKKQLVAGPERRYYDLEGQGLTRLQLAIILNFALVVGCGIITTLFKLELYPENRLRLVIFSQVLAMMISGLLCCNLMLDSLGDLLKGRFTINTLVTITFAACFADGIFCLKELRIPCCAAFCLEAAMAQWARYHLHTTEMAQMDTMRKAVRLSGIVKVPQYYKNTAGLLRKDAEVDDFMNTYRRMGGPELLQSIYAGISLLLCIGIAIYSGIFHGVSMGVQIFAASLLVAVPATFFLAVTRPMALLENRLHMVGSVLCGWQGVKGLCGKNAFPLTDVDLFPKGATKLNGFKFYSERDPDEVVAYTAALINRAGGSLVPVFQQLCSSRNVTACEADSFLHYGADGFGGEVRGESVLLGTLQFLQDMGVEIPEGTMVNQAVYAAIDGQLCAVYAMSYAKMRSAAAGLVSLCGYRKLTPILMSNDFSLNESFLRGKFGIKTRRLVFPGREERLQLESISPEPDSRVLAISTREDLVSFAYLITGARSLRTSTKLAVGIHLVGGILGLLIMAALAFLGNTALLTPTNILLYQLIWAIPGLLVTEWTRIG